jgi:hypothetical protein
MGKKPGSGTLVGKKGKGGVSMDAYRTKNGVELIRIGGRRSCRGEFFGPRINRSGTICQDPDWI